MKKRRLFDLDMPDELGDEAAVRQAGFPAGKVAEQSPPILDANSAGTAGEPRRRGPMATAVLENREALQARAEVEAAIRAENDALAAELVRLKGQGLIVDLVPVHVIDTTKLARDRIMTIVDDMDLAELKTSIRDIGLSNPIQVEPAAAGRFELVQGLRRLTAYRQLFEETKDPRYAAIPAGLMTDAGGLDQLYRRMVDENLVRKDISFAEMATLARDYAKDPRTNCGDPDKAVTILFQSAGYQKRSYIRAFVAVIDQLGDALKFPQQIPRNLGLELRRRLDTEPEIGIAIRDELKASDNRSVEDELRTLRRWAGAGEQDEIFPAGKVAKPQAKATRKAKVTFDMPRTGGTAKCTAFNGRLEVRLPVDFSTINRRRLEDAVRRMLDQLDQEPA